LPSSQLVKRLQRCHPKVHVPHPLAHHHRTGEFVEFLQDSVDPHAVVTFKPCIYRRAIAQDSLRIHVALSRVCADSFCPFLPFPAPSCPFLPFPALSCPFVTSLISAGGCTAYGIATRLPATPRNLTRWQWALSHLQSDPCSRIRMRPSGCPTFSPCRSSSPASTSE
jgi:hypothetical protein